MENICQILTTSQIESKCKVYLALCRKKEFSAPTEGVLFYGSADSLFW
jgi:hypothetical protein